MVEFITKLKEKPRTVRQYYAFAFAGFFTLMLGLIWVSTLPARVSFLRSEEPLAAVEPVTEERIIAPAVVPPEAPTRLEVWRAQVASLFTGWRAEPEPAEVPLPPPREPVQPWNELREAAPPPSVNAVPILIGTTSAPTTTASTTRTAPSLPATQATTTSSSSVLQ